ncbi:MAG: HEAT repeat domain-containing protein [Aureliella sp.]
MRLPGALWQLWRSPAAAATAMATGLILSSLAPAWGQQRDSAKERELIAVLTAQETAPADKAITCKQLALHGGPDAAAALAPLLADDHLASWARIALEAIPGPEAAAVLREAAGKLSGRLLIGTLNSIGVRGDSDSFDVLSSRLDDQDADVASAAALALGRVGGEKAEKLLREKLSAAPPAVRSAVAEGCILCAERHLADSPDVAVDIYDAVRSAEVTKPRVLEATRGAIIARKTEGLPLLLEQLRSSDLAFQRLGLTVARELTGKEVTEALAKEVRSATPKLAPLLLISLADRGDRAALPAVLVAAKNGQPATQIAAAEVLLSLGDVQSLPVLIELALATNKDVADAAQATLAALPGKEVDQEIVTKLDSASGQTLPLLIELVGQRRIAAVAALRKLVDSNDAAVRHAALAALGETVEAKDLQLLIDRLTGKGIAADAAVSQQALRAAAVRMAAREACAQQLANAMSGQSTEVKNRLLEILGEVGGSNALAAMRAAAVGNDPQLRDTASRLLGSWFDVDAGPVLLELAQMPGNQFNVRALRGYIRLARQFTMSDQQRAQMCRNAMQATDRTAEQQLVLEVMQRYPSPEMLKVAKEVKPNPQLADEAQRVTEAIAAKLAGQRK